MRREDIVFYDEVEKLEDIVLHNVVVRRKLMVRQRKMERKWI